MNGRLVHCFDTQTGVKSGHAGDNPHAPKHPFAVRSKRMSNVKSILLSNLPQVKRLQNIVGLKFGRWTVLEKAEQTIPVAWGKMQVFLCRCDCGVERLVGKVYLLRGQSLSCGCLRLDAHPRRIKHGGCVNGRSREYLVWVRMISRCTNQNDRSYPDYGGRGIKVCDQWLAFSTFLNDMGDRPTDKHTIERCNNNGNYEPSNCRWAVRAEQNRNKRDTVFFTHEGETLCMSDWARRLGVPIARMRTRYCTNKWTIRQSLGIDPPPGRSKGKSVTTLTSGR